jgi:hypothetical protein
MATSEVRAKTVLSRRALLRASALAAGGGVLGVPVVRADDSAPATDRLPALIALSTALVGGGRIDPERASQLLSMIDADEANAAALDDMLAANPAAVIAEPAAFPLAATILTYWYRGEYEGAPVPGRDTFWYGLSAWQAVRYTSATSICKRFGDWAEAPLVQ